MRFFYHIFFFIALVVNAGVEQRHVRLVVRRCRSGRRRARYLPRVVTAFLRRIVKGDAVVSRIRHFIFFRFRYSRFFRLAQPVVAFCPSFAFQILIVQLVDDVVNVDVLCVD